MDEHMLYYFGLGNGQQLTECVLIIVVIFIAMIFTMLYFGQRTRATTPFANCRANCGQRAGGMANDISKSVPAAGHNRDLRGGRNV